MKAVLQRVTGAKVCVDGEVVGQIGAGILVLLGVAEGDTERDAAYIAEKLAFLRIFEDEAGKMNLSLRDIGGQALVVSQFTLLADCRKGRRPGFSQAAAPELARNLYEVCVERLCSHGVEVQTGRFQAHMEVSLLNDGPVTLLLDSRKE